MPFPTISTRIRNRITTLPPGGSATRSVDGEGGGSSAEVQGRPDRPLRPASPATSPGGGGATTRLRRDGRSLWLVLGVALLLPGAGVGCESTAGKARVSENIRLVSENGSGLYFQAKDVYAGIRQRDLQGDEFTTEMDKVLRLLDAAVVNDPGNPLFRSKRADVWLELGQFDLAQKGYDNARLITEDWVPSWIGTADIALINGDYALTDAMLTSAWSAVRGAEDSLPKTEDPFAQLFAIIGLNVYLQPNAQHPDDPTLSAVDRQRLLTNWLQESESWTIENPDLKVPTPDGFDPGGGFNSSISGGGNRTVDTAGLFRRLRASILYRRARLTQANPPPPAEVQPEASEAPRSGKRDKKPKQPPPPPPTPQQWLDQALTWDPNYFPAKLMRAELFLEAGQVRDAEPLDAEVIVAVPGDAPDTVGALASAEACDEPHPTSPQDTAVILYTSGTTGKPKGAELTHSNLVMNCAVVVPSLMPEGADGKHRALATLPLFHSFGQTVIQNGLIATGGSLTLLPRFTPEEAFELIERDRLTLFAGVPTMYFALLHHRGDRAHDVSSLLGCFTGGAPMPVEVMTAFEEKFNVVIQEGFGLSETSPVSSFTVPHKPRKTGSIGYPVWGVEMCIVDDDDNRLADGDRGEICVRGHNVMKGYLNRPDANAEALKNGWFHTGDVGYRDEDGCYFIVDRKKDMILRGGFNVYPREVEEVLYEHEDVVEAAVIGVPHESHGEEVKAVVALGPDAKASADDLQAFCKDRLAAYKYPRLVEIVDALPKGPTGKILKRELRD